MRYSLLISPLADGAYFNDVVRVAQGELAFVAALEGHPRSVGPIRFVDVECGVAKLSTLARLSWVQGIFEEREGALVPLDLGPSLSLPRPFIWGDKYSGKTNELATQLALNLALAACKLPDKHRRVFDPMAGRGTTLLWAAAYGLDAVGIERDRGCVDHLHRHIKRQSKLHRVSHRAHLGQVGKKNRADVGRLGRYTFDDVSVELIVGDSTHAAALLGERKFGLIVADAPYGVAHMAADGTRGLLEDLRAALPGWLDVLRPGGAGAIVFNALVPKRPPMVDLLRSEGLEVVECDIAHRMSESIERDIVVFNKP